MLPHFEVFAPASTERGVKKLPLVLDDGTNLKSKDNTLGFNGEKLDWWHTEPYLRNPPSDLEQCTFGSAHFHLKCFTPTWKNEVSADHFWCAGKSFQETSTLVSSFGIEACNTSIPSPACQHSQVLSREKLALPREGNMFQPTDTHKRS